MRSRSSSGGLSPRRVARSTNRLDGSAGVKELDDLSVTPGEHVRGPPAAEEWTYWPVGGVQL